MKKQTQLSIILKGERPLLLGLGLALIVQSGVSMIQPWPLQIIFDYIVLDKAVPESMINSLGET